MGIGYAETQAYLDHFRNHGCDSQIIDNTAGLFNLCFYMAGTIDQLCEELKKKQVNIIRLQQLVFGLRGQADEAPDEPDGDEAESKASTSSQPEAGHGERSSPTSQSEHQTDDNPPSKPGHDPKKPPPGDEKKKPKGHGRYGIDA